MSDKTTKRVHKICPCGPCDIEGIQSWLEDMADNGLFLAEDGVFCGVFSFEHGTPRRTIYRLDVAQKRKPRFLDSGDELTDEQLELYSAMGWEYLVKYGDFHIYRSAEQTATELNTESETHVITISLLKQKHRSAFISSVVMALFWIVFTQSALRYSFRMAAVGGIGFLLCIHGIILDAWITNLFRVFRFRRYEKRLLNGDSINHRTEWQKNALLNYCARALPFVLSFGIAVMLLAALNKYGTKIPNTEYPGDPPFATVTDTFPDGTVTENNVWLDYGTYTAAETAVAKNVEWNESCDIITADGENFFCILRLSYHETAAEWIARGLEKDYYNYDANRYHRKRFEDLPAPNLDVDSIRVYNSYRTLYVLMRDDNRVVHAVVTMNNQTDANNWQLWAEAMAEKIKQ